MMLDERDFTHLPVRDKMIVLRMVGAVDYGTWRDRFDEVIIEAMMYRMIRGWFVFTDDDMCPDAPQASRQGSFEMPVPVKLEFL